MKLYLKSETDYNKGLHVIRILEMLGGKNRYLLDGTSANANVYYFIDGSGDIDSDGQLQSNGVVYSLNEFISKYPYNIGEMVSDAKDYLIGEIVEMAWDEKEGEVMYGVSFGKGIDFGWYNVKCLMKPQKMLQKTSNQPTTESKPDLGEISDGYHTFNELYEYRLLYNAAFFNEFAKQELYDVHKSKKHSDGKECFDGSWFIVMAELPTGQISNHYELKDWELFQVPEKEKANKWDGHTPQDVAQRMRRYLNPKFPSTIYDCADVLCLRDDVLANFNKKPANDYECALQHWTINMGLLRMCRDAYWKLCNNWNPKNCKWGDEVYYMNSLPAPLRDLFPMPTAEALKDFYDNFKQLLKECEDFLN